MYNLDSIVFADRVGDYTSLVDDGADNNVKMGPGVTIHGPEFKDYVSGSRTVYVEANPRMVPCSTAFDGLGCQGRTAKLAPTTVMVHLGSQSVEATAGANGLWTAEVDSTPVPDGRVAISATAAYAGFVGQVFYAGGATYSHDVFVANTPAAPNADPYVIDDFESYDSTDDNRTDVERVWWRTSDVMNGLRLRNSDDTYPADHWLSKAWTDKSLDTGAVLRVKYDVVPKNGAEPSTMFTKTYPAAARPDWSAVQSFSALVQPDGKEHFLKFQIGTGDGAQNTFECDFSTAGPAVGYNPALVAPQRVAVPIECFTSLGDGTPIAAAQLAQVQTVSVRIQQNPDKGRMAGLNALEYYLLDDLAVSKAPAVSAGAIEALEAILPAYLLYRADQEWGRYTVESYAPMEAALVYAESLVAAGVASELAVANAIGALESAAAGLIEAVDTSALDAAIAQAQAILADPSGWVSVNLPALQVALSAAEDALADPDLTQAQADEAAEALWTALAAVSPKGDKTGLQALVTVVESLDSARYTPASWSPVQGALDSAGEIIQDLDASEEEVNAAFADLSGVLAGLVLRAAKAGLGTAIEIGETILAAAGSYEPASLTGLAGALNEAREVYADDDATVAAVSSAQTALIAKIAVVRLKPSAGSAAAPVAAGLLTPAAAAVAAAEPEVAAAEVAEAQEGLVGAAQVAEVAEAASARFAKVAKPRIVGVTRVGKRLSAKAGTWAPSPKLSYQWYRGSKKIAQATKATYKLRAADRGKRITVKVTAKKVGYATVVRASAKTARIK
jgi:hypothetical protein